VVDKHFLVALGKRIRRRRFDLELTQEELAARSGISDTLVSMVERGLKRLSMETVIAFSRGLDVTPGWFFDRTK
jgi:XRE family transcriptional regulator, regulator of sulfur utilization